MAILVLFMFTFGDDGTAVTFENRLPETVDVYGLSLIVDDLAPGSEYEHMELEFDSFYTYEARDQSGTTVASATITWDQLKAQGFRVIFE